MENNKKKQAKCIFNMGLAKALIDRGCVVCGLKPDRNNKDKTVVVFKCDDHFWEEFEKINKEIAAAKAEEKEAQ